ncbi:MAG: MFS transporter, partial [Steroidobacteraceae bacterium]|nr:MFS transporter [Steroidobacteraceae bacterium]
MAAALVLLAALVVPRGLLGAVVAIAIVLLVLAPLPPPTRPVVGAVMAGLATGVASINLFAPGIFQEHVTREFGWTQPQYAGVITVGTVVTVVSSAFVGTLFDRYGVRRWAIAGIVLLAAMLISLRWLTPNLWHFYGVFALLPILAAGTSSIAYSRVIARWFDRRRGQAFGAALAGIGVGGAILSPLTQFLIAQLGWRDAYAGLGLLGLCVTLPIVWWALYDTPAERGLAPDGEPLAPAPITPNAHPAPARDAGSAATAGAGAYPTPIGYSAGESLRQQRFWRMLVAFVLMAFAIGGVMLQFVPILRARGVPAEQAVAVLG